MAEEAGRAEGEKATEEERLFRLVSLVSERVFTAYLNERSVGDPTFDEIATISDLGDYVAGVVVELRREGDPASPRRRQLARWWRI